MTSTQPRPRFWFPPFLRSAAPAPAPATAPAPAPAPAPAAPGTPFLRPIFTPTFAPQAPPPPAQEPTPPQPAPAAALPRAPALPAAPPPLAPTVVLPPRASPPLAPTAPITTPAPPQLAPPPPAPAATPRPLQPQVAAPAAPTPAPPPTPVAPILPFRAPAPQPQPPLPSPTSSDTKTTPSPPTSAPPPKAVSPPPQTLPPVAQSKPATVRQPDIPPEAEQKIVLVQETSENSKLATFKPSVGEVRGPLTTAKNGKFTEKGDQKMSSDSDQKGGMRITMLAGENRGAIMELSSSRKIGTTWSEGEGRSKMMKDEKMKGPTMSLGTPMKAFTNSNVQGVNNSILYSCSCTHNDPGVHLSLSRKPTRGKN